MKRKPKFKYVLACLGLLFALLLISSFGMWLVQEFLDHFNGKKYGEAVVLADNVWQQPEESSEVIEMEPILTAAETDSEEEFLNTILLDGNRLNDIQRLQVQTELSLKKLGSYYKDYLDREPIEEIELSEAQARERAFEFLEMMNHSVPAEYLPYQPDGEINMYFRADKIHPSAALWVADFSSYGCTAFLYMDAKTGLPVRFRADYNWELANYYDSGTEYENVFTINILTKFRDWQTDNPVFIDMLLPYLAEFLNTNFYTSSVPNNSYPETFSNGYRYLLPVEQWMTEDYRYTLLLIQETTQFNKARFDLVLSPIESQEAVKETLSKDYENTFTGME